MSYGCDHERCKNCIEPERVDTLKARVAELEAGICNLIAANDKSLAEFRPRPDIAWRELKRLVSGIPDTPPASVCTEFPDPCADCGEAICECTLTAEDRADLARPIEEVDAEIRSMGVDPIELGKRGAAFVEGLKAYRAEAPHVFAQDLPGAKPAQDSSAVNRDVGSPPPDARGPATADGPLLSPDPERQNPWAKAFGVCTDPPQCDAVHDGSRCIHVADHPCDHAFKPKPRPSEAAPIVALLKIRDEVDGTDNSPRPNEATCWDCAKPSDMPPYCWACLRAEQASEYQRGHDAGYLAAIESGNCCARSTPAEARPLDGSSFIPQPPGPRQAVSPNASNGCQHCGVRPGFTCPTECPREWGEVRTGEARPNLGARASKWLDDADGEFIGHWKPALAIPSLGVLLVEVYDEGRASVARTETALPSQNLREIARQWCDIHDNLEHVVELAALLADVRWSGPLFEAALELIDVWETPHSDLDAAMKLRRAMATRTGAP